MSSMGSIVVDFDAAIDICKKIRECTDRIVEDAVSVDKALAASTETNNQQNLGRVHGGFNTLLPQLSEMSANVEQIIKAIETYQETYANEVDTAELDRDIWE